MKIKLFTMMIALLSFTPSNIKKMDFRISKSENSKNTYYSIEGENLPSKESFDAALSGYLKYKELNIVKKNIITIIDFNLSSTKKRLWVIDLDNNKVVFNTLVAHGKNTGNEYATSFSNSNESNKSSLGFYKTSEVYQGKHGKSLRIDGLEIGKNDNARIRAVVIHGADYVSEKFISQHKRLGRSLGCPALPSEVSSKIINYIKDDSCIFIYYK